MIKNQKNGIVTDQERIFQEFNIYFSKIDKTLGSNISLNSNDNYSERKTNTLGNRSNTVLSLF